MFETKNIKACGMVWYGMVWYGMVWYGMVWYGMVWYGMVLLLLLLLSSYLSRIPTSPKCFSVGSCNFKLQYINSIFSHALFTATHIYNIII